MPITIVGIITVYIAWRQWQTSRQRLQLDMYDRRLRIYNEVQGFIVKATNGPKSGLENLIAFYAATAEADFLFGKPPNPIRSYLDELSKHAGRYLTLQQKYDHAVETHEQTRAMPSDYDHEAVVAEKNEELRWLSDQHTVALQKFSKYLSMRA